MLRIFTSVRDHCNIKFQLSYHILHELITTFCTEIITEPRGYKYLWYKIHYRKLLKGELEKKWSLDFIDIVF